MNIAEARAYLLDSGFTEVGIYRNETEISMTATEKGIEISGGVTTIYVFNKGEVEIDKYIFPAKSVCLMVDDDEVEVDMWIAPSPVVDIRQKLDKYLSE